MQKCLMHGDDVKRENCEVRENGDGTDDGGRFGVR